MLVSTKAVRESYYSPFYLLVTTTVIQTATTPSAYPPELSGTFQTFVVVRLHCSQAPSALQSIL